MTSESGLCPLGSKPLFCATWHACCDVADRQRRLDAWAAQHRKQRETPRGPLAIDLRGKGSSS